MSEFNLKTGDILLFDFHGGGFFKYVSSLIKYFTNSNYSHVAMVLKDPTFIHPTLKGYYVWQSSWSGITDPQDDRIKFGVQITPFYELYQYYKKNNSRIVVRRINSNKHTFNTNKLKDIHNIVYNKPYDIIPSDWIDGLMQKDEHPQKVTRFWCSALVGYIYTMCGILNKKTDWRLLRTSDFSYTNNLNWENNYSLSSEEYIL